MEASKEKKKMITTGMIRWWIFIIAPLLFVLTGNMIQEGSYHPWKILFLFVLAFVVYILWKRRQLKFDSKNLYILRGKDETIVPFTNILSIKKSKGKVNGQRYWILIYIDKHEREQKLRFDSDFDDEFHDAVREKNPEVIIWTHPFFNH